MTETQIEQLGFDLVKRFNHDEFATNRFLKGHIEVDFTYKQKNDELVHVDFRIDEVDSITITFEEIKDLDRILNKN